MTSYMCDPSMTTKNWRPMCESSKKNSDKTNNSLFNSKMWGKENNLTLESLCVVSVCVIMTEKSAIILRRLVEAKFQKY